MIRGVRVFAALMLATVVGVSACGKKKPAPPPAAPTPAAEAPRTTPPPPPAPATPARETAPRVPTDDEIFAGKSLDALNAEKPLGDAFFPLDSAQLGDEAKPILQKNADWLRRWPSTKIVIEGHADSRGTAEYNLALGERRAVAVSDYLASLGIPHSRIAIVSKGKESPFCREETDSCWQQNRRGHFIITAK